MLKLDPLSTALVLIDLQKGIVKNNLFPYKSEQILKNNILIAECFRRVGATVVLVNLAFSNDLKDLLSQEVDQPYNPLLSGESHDDFSKLVDGLKHEGDILITKRQWSAFHGTELDLQLRRRSISTIVLAGISTNIGVESTARQAYDHYYSLITVEDATTAYNADMHHFAFQNIFPKISKVIKTDLCLDAFSNK